MLTIDGFMTVARLARDKNIVLYSGNIGEKRRLENVVDAMERLRDHSLILRFQRGCKVRLENGARTRSAKY